MDSNASGCIDFLLTFAEFRIFIWFIEIRVNKHSWLTDLPIYCRYITKNENKIVQWYSLCCTRAACAIFFNNYCGSKHHYYFFPPSTRIWYVSWIVSGITLASCARAATSRALRYGSEACPSCTDTATTSTTTVPSLWWGALDTDVCSTFSLLPSTCFIILVNDFHIVFSCLLIYFPGLVQLRLPHNLVWIEVSSSDTSKSYYSSSSLCTQSCLTIKKYDNNKSDTVP